MRERERERERQREGAREGTSERGHWREAIPSKWLSSLVAQCLACLSDAIVILTCC